MSVVGTLTVDLVANTASFTADLGAAGNSLDNLGKTASAAGASIDHSMTEARGAIALTGEELGVHIPRHLQTLIAAIPGVGMAFAEMLPIVGVIAAIAIITKLIAKNEEAKEKMAQGWDKFGAVEAGVFNDLGDKMLEVGKKADELAGNHLAALEKELKLIDHASMRELAEEFGKLEGAADKVMLQLKSSWYEIRMGSQGAENALTRFTGEYDLLLAKGDKKGAFDKLVGTLDSANARLAQLTAQENTMFPASQKMVDAQRLLVGILEDQLRVTKEVAAINTGEKSNTRTEDAKKEEADLDERNEMVKEFCDKALKAEQEFQKERAKEREKGMQLMIEMGYAENKGVEEAWKEQLKAQAAVNAEELKSSLTMAKLKEQADEEAAHHSLAMHKENAQQATALEVAAAEDRLKIELDALNKEIASLDQHDSQYLAKLKELENKKKEIVQQSENEITKIRDQAEQKQFQDINKAEQQMADAVAKNVIKSILESKNMGLAFEKMGAQMLESASENILKMIMLGNMQQAKNAAHAAAGAYSWVMREVPPPMAFPLAAAAAGVAFAGVMAFADGGEVPGFGSGDTVPAMLTPGESVVTKALTDQVKGNRGGGGHTVHVNTTVNAVDAEHFGALLDKHASVVSRHLNNQLRKMNARG
jgi:hypothetical protein